MFLKGKCDRPTSGLFGDIHAVALGVQLLGSLFTLLVVEQIPYWLGCGAQFSKTISSSIR